MSDERAIAVLLVGAAALYLVHHYGMAQGAWLRRLQGRRVGGLTAQAASVLVQRATSGAVLIAGGLALLAATGRDVLGSGFGTTPSLRTFGYAAAAGAVVLGPVWLAGRKDATQARYPHIRDPQVSVELGLVNLAAWGWYLLGYELLFRGVLLFPLVEPFGLEPALAISTALYVFAHLHKEGGETAACLLMGLVFGGMAWADGSIWAPWLLHVAITVVGETSAARHHPGLRWWVRG